MSLLNLVNVSMLEQGRYILRNISFTQKPFQKIAIAGSTGSGKTSLLKIIAGLIELTEGSAFFNTERIKGPNERLIAGHPSIAYLSQHFELRNHYRVEELLEMVRKVTKEEAEEIYKVCRIDHLLKRWSHELSGGEKQRIALARLLVASPKLLLLDEPYSNLDPFHKNTLKQVIDELSEKLAITCILVSHDPVDALSWADEIIVLKDGVVIQTGTPQDVYYNPADEYVAALFGTYNLLNKGSELLEKFSVNGSRPLFVRPEDIRFVGEGVGISAEIKTIRFKGSFFEIEMVVAGKSIVAYTNQNLNGTKKAWIAIAKTPFQKQ